MQRRLDCARTEEDPSVSFLPALLSIRIHIEAMSRQIEQHITEGRARIWEHVGAGNMYSNDMTLQDQTATASDRPAHQGLPIWVDRTSAAARRKQRIGRADEVAALALLQPSRRRVPALGSGVGVSSVGPVLSSDTPADHAPPARSRSTSTAVERRRIDSVADISGHPQLQPQRRPGPTAGGASGRGKASFKGSYNQGNSSVARWREQGGWTETNTTALSIDDLSLLETLMFYTYTADQEQALLRAAAALLTELIERRRLVLGVSSKVVIHATASTSDAELDEVLQRYVKAVGATPLRPEKALLVLMDAWAELKKTVGSSVESRLLDYGVCYVRNAHQHGLLGNEWLRSRWMANVSFRDQLYREVRRLVRAGKPIDSDHSILLYILNTSPQARHVFGPGLDRNKIARLCMVDPLAYIVNDAYNRVRAHTTTWARRR